MRKNIRISVITLAIILAIFSGIGITYFYGNPIRYWNEQSVEIQKHKKIWSEQDITKYRIGINLLGYPENCSRELVVDDNVITQVIKDDCKYASDFGTVDSLFSMIQRMVDNKMCGANGCDCDGPFIIDAVYDEKYGFPKIGNPATHPEKRWMFGAKFFSFCTLLGDLGIGWNVYSFSPIP
jgi:hypothetical protein